jgi:hypothetical protein
MVQPTTCCGKSGSAGGCVCASQAKCSCGKNAALQCDCAQSVTENAVQGPRCSCRQYSAYCFSFWVFLLLFLLGVWNVLLLLKVQLISLGWKFKS